MSISQGRPLSTRAVLMVGQACCTVPDVCSLAIHSVPAEQLSNYISQNVSGQRVRN